MHLFPVKSYFEYFFKARHYKGHGIHSPFMYEMVTDVLYDKNPFYAFGEIEGYRNMLKKNRQSLDVTDHGAGSHALKSRKRKVSDIYKHSAIRAKYGQVLFRLINKYKCKNIVELGTSLGVSTLYLALTGISKNVYTIEGCPETAAFAQSTFDWLKLENVKLITGRFSNVLPGVLEKLDTLDFLFIDGHHEQKATIEYFRMCKQKAGYNSIFVFDDIHWSKGMERAWTSIISDSDVTVSVDLYQLGVVFFCKECKKQHYVVRY